MGYVCILLKAGKPHSGLDPTRNTVFVRVRCIRFVVARYGIITVWMQLHTSVRLRNKWLLGSHRTYYKSSDNTKFRVSTVCNCRSQWPRGLRCRSEVARPLRLWVRIPPRAWMFVVSVVCCQVLRRTDPSSRGVIPTVVRRRVWSRNLVNEEALANWGMLRQKQST